MNKVNPFPALTAPRLPVFLPNLSIRDKAALVANLAKSSLAERTTRFFSAFFYLNLLSYYQNIHLIELF